MNTTALIVIILVVLLLFGLPQNPYGYGHALGGGYWSPGVILLIILAVILLR